MRANVCAQENSAVSPLDIQLSCGQDSTKLRQFFLRLDSSNTLITDIKPVGLETEDRCESQILRLKAGGGDVDSVRFRLSFESNGPSLANPHEIWNNFFNYSDSETAQRMHEDAGFRRDSRKLEISTNESGTRGFSVTIDQLQRQRAFWIPALDLFLTVGDGPTFADYQRELAQWKDQRILQQVRLQPEASYEYFKTKWEDMGSPAYKNSYTHGHRVVVAWDNSLAKFAIDNAAGVSNDLSDFDNFGFEYNFDANLSDIWKGQQLDNGLPIITTHFQRDATTFDVEQFACPLHSEDRARRGDIPLVFMQKVLWQNSGGQPVKLKVSLRRTRDILAAPVLTSVGDALVLESSDTGRVLLGVSSANITDHSVAVKTAQNDTTVELTLTLTPRGEMVIRLPSPFLKRDDRADLVNMDYGLNRAITFKFWSDYLARGALFEVPEKAVNDLFRANLWHAIRLPRRHGGEGANVPVDFPYSNTAYDQNGTPWPINQALYVDYCLYDLRGYPALSQEDFSIIYRNNQESNGHVGGYASWGSYTPAMIYSVSQHYLLSGDRQGFEALLPATLRAYDWCLNEMIQAKTKKDATSGLVDTPLNDLTSDHAPWAFNQAYFYAASDMLSRALAKIGHPRAESCREASVALRVAIDTGFGTASRRSPLVQLRDHTWIPYVPVDANRPERLMEVWYPTDVDVGPLHLPRLNALDPHGDLTNYMLNDHEDNLFLKNLGMANEPVYNQQGTVYLERDAVKPAIRTFYSMMACAFSHSVYEPVEHRWGWGQYFGPPSTDGAWFELYRNMLVREQGDNSLMLLQATPRKWLSDGQSIRIERAPTYYGPLSLNLKSEAKKGLISVKLTPPLRDPPKFILVRLRHPETKPMRQVTVNGQKWSDFDIKNEWVRLRPPFQKSYVIIANYKKPKLPPMP